jgi:hypothetical protein
MSWITGIVVRIPAWARVFPSSDRLARLWNPSSPLFNGYLQLFPRWWSIWGGGGEEEAHHLAQSSAEIKHEWTYTSTPVYMPSWRTQDKCYFALTLSPRHGALWGSGRKQTLDAKSSCSQKGVVLRLGSWAEALDSDEFLGLYSPSNIFGVNESRAKRSVGYVARTGRITWQIWA